MTDVKIESIRAYIDHTEVVSGCGVFEILYQNGKKMTMTGINSVETDYITFDDVIWCLMSEKNKHKAEINEE